MNAEYSDACICEWPADGFIPIAHPDCPRHWDLADQGADERHIPGGERR